MKLIATATASGSSGTLSLTSIPQTYTDLVILLSGRNSADTFCEVRPNAATTSLTSRTLQGSGSAVGSENLSYIRCTVNANRTANTFGNATIYIANYAGATNKSISIDGVEENNGTDAISTLTAGLWSNTAAITSVDLVCASAGTWQSGSIVSIYGILKGSDGIVTTS
jgi:hypothetical protein